MKELTTIPVIVDDIKRMDEFQMTRCSYYSIEAETTSSNWIVELENRKIPHYLFGLQGLLTNPIGGGEFQNPGQITSIIEQIEFDDSLIVDINDIWLPNNLFDDRPHKRGDVYRISLGVYSIAHKYRYNQISADRYISSCIELKNEIRYSQMESETFAEWAKSQVEEAKMVYKKNKKYQLDYIEKRNNKKP